MVPWLSASSYMAVGGRLGRAAGAAALSASMVRRVTADVDVSYRWHESPVPRRLKIVKVHGFLICPATGRTLLQECAGRFNLPGGSPEPVDADLEATLVRETMEESQVVVTGTAYLGYQEVHEAGCRPYAQVRMAGMIGRFGSRRQDCDSGRLLRRLMCPLADVASLLGWGSIMGAQAAAAARAAQLLWGVPVDTAAPAGYAD
jgi:8-oxo-dGTP diphosphatase